jgi:imidazoleglycerol phosphate dehydratase HisB
MAGSRCTKAEGDDDRRKIEAMAIALGRAIRRAARDDFEKR